ncbi:MAG: glycosyltransferase family 4 protein [Candidatus Krumholzibacteriia bacterium]
MRPEPARPGDPEPHLADLGPAVRLETVPFQDRDARGPTARLQLIADRVRAAWLAWRRGHPYSVAKYHQPRLSARASELVRDFAPDVVQVEYLQLAGVALDLAARRPPGRPPRLVLDSHEHGALPRRRRAALAGPWRRRRLEAEAAAWDRLACEVSRRMDAVLCVTEQDRRLLADAGAVNLVTVPLGIDTDALRPRPADAGPPQALFVGSFAHPPNRDAATLLCDRIWPAVQAALPGWRLVLAGPGSREFLVRRTTVPAGIEARGFVADLDPLFAASRLFLAPLFTGGGIKIKILEAMARGIPLVTTPIGAEGIATRDQDLVGWATDPDTFIAAVVDLAGRPEAAAERAARARDHVVREFSWTAVIGRLEVIYRGGPVS